MMRKVKKAPFIHFFLNLYFLFFVGVVQFNHGHDAIGYLNLGEATADVVVVGAHCHSSDADYPLFESHELAPKQRIECLLCTFTNWLFLRCAGNESSLTVNVFISEKKPAVKHIQKPIASCYYRRAPPAVYPLLEIIS